MIFRLSIVQCFKIPAAVDTDRHYIGTTHTTPTLIHELLKIEISLSQLAYRRTQFKS